MTDNTTQPNSSSNSKTENPTPELPHLPKLPTPQPPGGVEAQSPTSSGQTPKPHFSAPGHLDPPV
ncbi:MAG TPA: hypothetical protein DEV81_07315 [Cyanobacteria bacterium UBA11049]|nr:hypothetical protein [Cyanobacteria bacterium UBA11049]